MAEPAKLVRGDVLREENLNKTSKDDGKSFAPQASAMKQGQPGKKTKINKLLHFFARHLSFNLIIASSDDGKFAKML